MTLNQNWNLELFIKKSALSASLLFIFSTKNILKCNWYAGSLKCPCML